jgi:hypothetical protein
MLYPVTGFEDGYCVGHADTRFERED